MNTSEGMKICPFCAEEIKAAAIKCRFCKKNIRDMKNIEYLINNPTSINIGDKFFCEDKAIMMSFNTKKDDESDFYLKLTDEENNIYEVVHGKDFLEKIDKPIQQKNKIEKNTTLIICGIIIFCIMICFTITNIIPYYYTMAAKDSFEKKNYNMAVDYYTKVITYNNKSPEAWYGKGLSLSKLGKYEEAITCFNNALNIITDDKLKNKKKEIEIILFKEKNKSKIQDLSVQAKKFISNKEYDKAIVCLENILKIDPLNKMALNKKSECKKLSDEMKMAMEAEKEKKSQELFNEGQNLFFNNNYAEAIKKYDEAIALAPGIYYAWTNKGQCLSTLGKYDEAIECFDKAIEIDSSKSDAFRCKDFSVRAQKRAITGSENYNTSENIILPDYPEMVFIEGGRFMMGSNNDENEQPIHPVTISSFYMGKYEITNKQYCIFLNSFDNVNNVYNIDLSKEDGGIIQQNGELIVKPGFENLPVVYVNWYGTLAYCSWLSKETNKTYKLPTEAQWEYACRAGSTTDYYWGNKIDENYCWYSGNSNGINHEVGLKSPNAFGLYDMSGNVWEWCGDYLGESYVPFEQVDPTGAFTGGCSLRGGGVVDNYFYCRSAYRGILPSDFRMKQFPHSGFRIVMY